MNEVLGDTPNQWNWRYFEGYKNLECTEATCSGRGENTTGYMSIYEFAHKCKEWAFDKGFVLKSYKKQGALSGTYHYAIDINENVAEWLSNTEQEAIFKACEWIMEQTKCGS